MASPRHNRANSASAPRDAQLNHRWPPIGSDRNVDNTGRTSQPSPAYQLADGWDRSGRLSGGSGAISPPFTGFADSSGAVPLAPPPHQRGGKSRLTQGTLTACTAAATLRALDIGHANPATTLFADRRSTASSSRSGAHRKPPTLRPVAGLSAAP